MTLDDIRGRATITVAEAAALLEVSTGSVYDAINNDGFPAITIGRRKVIPVAAFLRMLDVPPEHQEPDRDQSGSKVATPSPNRPAGLQRAGGLHAL